MNYGQRRKKRIRNDMTRCSGKRYLRMYYNDGLLGNCRRTQLCVNASSDNGRKAENRLGNYDAKQTGNNFFERRTKMGMDKSMIMMVGYDISKLSNYIEELETSKDDWIDGIPEYCLNYDKVEIGYDTHTRSMFGRVIFDMDEVDFLFEGESTVFELPELEQDRAAIWAKYKQFLFDHTKITDKAEPPFVVKIITWSS